MDLAGRSAGEALKRGAQPVRGGLAVGGAGTWQAVAPAYQAAVGAARRPVEAAAVLAGRQLLQPVVF